MAQELYHSHCETQILKRCYSRSEQDCLGKSNTYIVSNNQHKLMVMSSLHKIVFKELIYDFALKTRIAQDVRAMGLALSGRPSRPRIPLKPLAGLS
jgi:hypothetical protein